MGRRVGRGTAGDDLGPPNPTPPPSPLRTDDDPSTKPTRVGTHKGPTPGDGAADVGVEQGAMRAVAARGGVEWWRGPCLSP